MGDPSRGDITGFLLELRDQGPDQTAAVDRLYSAVYEEMRRMAGRLMRRENGHHTLQPTALVHEAYLKLVDQRRVQWEDRTHFFATAARVMRHILVDHARRKARDKRGGGWRRVTLDTALGVGNKPFFETIALDKALSRLSELDDRMGRIVELRIFAGLTAKEVAFALGISKRTVDGDWMVARRWLANELTGGGAV